MREIPSAEPYPRKSPEQIKNRERVKIQSELVGPKGERPEITVAIAEDGAIRRINFWDIDKTVLYAHDVHFAAIVKIFPEAAARDAGDVQTTFEAGWRLGTTIRELDRMYRIFIDGKDEYRDPDVYRKEFIADSEKRKLIDEPGHPEGLHERSAEMLARYTVAACAALQEIYEQNSETFPEEFLMPSTIHLLEAKSRLGEMNVFMTANARDLANGLLTYSGLFRYGFAVAGEEDMIGGGKEVAIQHLLKLIEQKTKLKIPHDRLVVLGDSPRGDVGSGFRVMQAGDYTFQGVLITENTDEAALFKAAGKSDPELEAMIAGMDVTVLASADAQTSPTGRFKLGRMGSAQARENQENRES